jgi:ornithine decarboxylase
MSTALATPAPARPELRVAPGPHVTPRLELDVSRAVAGYAALARTLPGTAVHYAVKANPHPALLAALARAGARFDVASPAEVRACLDAGADPEDLVCSNPVKRRDDVAATAALGVRLFVVDSPEETRKVAEAAPRAAVLCRLVTSGSGSDWPLSRKYGCSTDEATAVLRLAASLGLDPAGVSFHVGSQQRDPQAWRDPVEASARIFRTLRAEGLRPHLLDLGGGFPAAHEGGAPALPRYADAIRGFLASAFGAERPATLVEPGRGIVGDAGTVVTRVIAVLRRGDARWVYLDCGVFTGLVETLEEAIRYRLETPGVAGPTGPCVLAGPTCDSADVMYERTPVTLPLALAEGDEVRIHSTGAYTACYSTVGFNGFDPLPTVLV